MSTVVLGQLLQAAICRADLEVVDSHFTEIGIANLTGFLHLKSAFVSLSNLADFELAARLTYKTHPEPSAIYKPLRKQFEFAKYLRNKFVGHIHPALMAKAIEWQPALRQVANDIGTPESMLMVNLWALETAINTYVMPNGEHRVFDSETDLMYPPDWGRFVAFLETTIRGGIEYLKTFQSCWMSETLSGLPNESDLELALRAGETEFKFLAQ